MTMPHLMNCSHSGDGWCLLCVNELYKKVEELDLIRETLQNGLDRDKDDTSTYNLAVIAINALKRARNENN